MPESLRNLTKLEELNLSGLGIMNIDNLSDAINVKSIKKLHLLNNKLSDLKPIREFNNLKELNLRSNQIKRIEGLEKLTNLRRLNLLDNKYIKIEGLENLINLEYLRIDLVEIDGLPNLEGLKELFVFYSDEIAPLLENLGGVNEFDGQIFEPQKIVDYCKKKNNNL